VEEFDPRLECRVCTTGKEGLKAFAGGEWDIVLVDFKLPDLNGLEIIGSIREQVPGQRVIMISSHPDERLPVSSMKLGVQEFISKDQLFGSRLEDALRGIYDTAGARTVDATSARTVDATSARTVDTGGGTTADATGAASVGMTWDIPTCMAGVPGRERLPGPELELNVYSAILDTMGEGVLTIDDGGTIMYANPSFIDMLGRTPGSVFGANILDFIADPHVDTFRRHLDKSLGGKKTRFQIDLKRPSSGKSPDGPQKAEPGRGPGAKPTPYSRDGNFEVMVAQSPYESRGGGINGSVMVVTDISRLKAAQRFLQDANRRLKEADRQKSEFVGIVAHDFGTPLGVMKGFLEILLMGLNGPLNEKQEQKLRKIRASVSRLDALRKETLDITRMDLGKLELDVRREDFSGIVKEALEEISIMAGDKKQELSLNLPGELVVECDRQRIRQAVDNYLSNAIRYTPEGGTITVSAVSTAPAGNGDGDGENGGDTVRFCVSDTGRGIAGDDLENVFLRFYRSGPKVEGSTGLGLSVVKGIIEAHGGRVWCRSDLGAGSSFYFEIPRFRPSSQRASPMK